MKKKFYPIILFIINKNLEISFNNIVMFFNLTINLLKKSSKKFLFNFKKII